MYFFYGGSCYHGFGDRREVVIKKEVVCAGSLRERIDAVGVGMVLGVEGHFGRLLGVVSMLE